jgi:hypothetical protein
MVGVSIRYEFQQPFNVPAAVAYAWATDFEPADADLFGDRRRRAIRRIAPDALVMTDTTYPAGRALRIARLVRIFPEKMAWTNTHLTGPFRHSQFWYRIVPDGPRRSYLDFQGLKVETRAHPLTPAAQRRESEANRLSDAATWSRHLAPALEAHAGAGRKQT